jgi:large subunit ribosomal protein L2
LQTKDLNVGDKIMSGSGSSLNIGNSLPLEIPLGTAIHNIELIPNRGGQSSRRWNISKTLAREGDYITLRLPSKKFV